MNNAIPKRPTKVSAESRVAISTRLADRMIESHGFKKDDRAEIAEDIAKHARQDMDGYQLAKTLEDRCQWSCNLEIAETLDEWSSMISTAMSDAETQWLIDNKIEPAFPANTHVSIRGGNKGIITGVYEYGAGKYLIKLDDDPQSEPPSNSRRIVNFEDVVLLDSILQPTTEN